MLRRMTASPRPASGAGVRSMRARPATSATRSPRPAAKRPNASSAGASNTARCARPNIEASQPSLPTSCSISSPTISGASPSSSPPEAESARKPENRLRQTENPTTKDGNGLSYRRFFSKLLERFAKSIADFAEKMTTYAGSAADPGEYGKLIAARLCPNTLPYELGTSAAFEVTSFNGRALADDALDVMLTLAANTPLVDGLAPDRGRIRKDFPSYGGPYTAKDRGGVTPMPRPVKK